MLILAYILAGLLSFLIAVRLDEGQISLMSLSLFVIWPLALIWDAVIWLALRNSE